MQSAQVWREGTAGGVLTFQLRAYHGLVGPLLLPLIREGSPQGLILRTRTIRRDVFARMAGENTLAKSVGGKGFVNMVVDAIAAENVGVAQFAFMIVYALIVENVGAVPFVLMGESSTRVSTAVGVPFVSMVVRPVCVESAEGVESVNMEDSAPFVGSVGVAAFANTVESAPDVENAEGFRKVSANTVGYAQRAESVEVVASANTDVREAAAQNAKRTILRFMKDVKSRKRDTEKMLHTAWHT
uniref:Uncharacterized protein n=1 Tax=Chromera velia CCMP2878 TaxID=1169474 RepID=A0A0K6S8B7_9ALVE|eukprot:Cvel_23820.t1-p1 / transcript=Cvel_23820.t1 / gene=Cvel_23820 / organism=Chromera_velia_CCMP2878 / gene_product=Zinc finger protein 571, putative / transcript_product=Zinc finger protein 571, putative / location=Cvel_scaffold2502:16979-17704(+) / protein_length=242 / sequence_SO=supercontig / SO=protein_coding / is_pseudo=false